MPLLHHTTHHRGERGSDTNHTVRAPDWMVALTAITTRVGTESRPNAGDFDMHSGIETVPIFRFRQILQPLIRLRDRLTAVVGKNLARSWSTTREVRD